MADPLDVLTLSEGKSALGIPLISENDDDEVAAYITAVSRGLDRKIGPTVARTITGEVHDGGCYAIVLRFRPVMSIASVTEYFGGSSQITLTQLTATSIPTDGYRLGKYEPQAGLYSGIVCRTTNRYDGRFAYGTDNVVFTYTAGRVASTTAVDEVHKRAASICLKNMWRDREQSAGQFNEFDVPVQNFPTFALPRAAAELLSEELGEDEPWGIA